MKQIALTICLAMMTLLSSAQTKTTTDLDAEVDGLSLYFYKNTLRMLNQDDNKDFDEMIKDIEKMRFLMIDRIEEELGAKEFQDLKAKYMKESYEEVMSSRMEGKSFDVYVRESGGKVKGTIILASDSSQLFVLDILGKIALDKVPAFFNSLDESSDIGGKIRDFMDADVH